MQRGGHLLARSFRTSPLVIFLCLTACSHAARVGVAPLVTDRPDFTESSETVAPGVVQLESGGTLAREASANGHSLGEVLARVGVTPGAELRIGLNSYTVSRSAGVRTSGLEDASIGTKVKLVRGGGRRPMVSLIALTSLPTGGKAFRQAKLQPEAKLTAAIDLSERVSFSSNLNHAWVRETGAQYTEWAGSGSFGIGLTDRVGAYVEYFGFYPSSGHGDAGHYVNSGFTLGLGPDTQLDVRGGVGLGHASGSDYFFGVGFSRRWQVGARK